MRARRSTCCSSRSPESSYGSAVDFASMVVTPSGYPMTNTGSPGALVTPARCSGETDAPDGSCTCATATSESLALKKSESSTGADSVGKFCELLISVTEELMSRVFKDKKAVLVDKITENICKRKEHDED